MTIARSRLDLGAAVLFILWMVAGASARAAPEEFDPSFGADGTLMLSGSDSTASQIKMLPDGGMLVVVNGASAAAAATTGVWRLDASGVPDRSFGGGDGLVAASELCAGACSILDVGLAPDGLYVMIGPNASAGDRVLKLAVDGSFDTTFGIQGATTLPGGVRFRRLAVDGAGIAMVIGEDFQDGHCVVHRMQRWGALDDAFGTGGVAAIALEGWAESALVQPDGRLLILSRTSVARLLADGRKDPGFGADGVVALNGLLSASAFAADGAGRIVLVGAITTSAPASYEPDTRLIVAVLRADGSTDASFGTGGVKRVTTEVADEDAFATAVAIDEAQRIVVVGDAGRFSYLPFNFIPHRAVVARLLSNGSADVHFAPAGSVAFRVGHSTESKAVGLQSDGRIVVAGASHSTHDFGGGKYPRQHPRAALYRLQGQATALARPDHESQAVEYFHAGHGHYFVTADPNETWRLDRDPSFSSQWSRTGRTFNVWSLPAGAHASVCRFWSDQSFAPRSSHFYTPYASECNALRQGTPWSHEGVVFAMALPNGGPGGAACPEGSRPLYRAYNNGQGGAPNHRYMSDAQLLDEMIAKSWIAEGDAQTRIFACVPVRP